MSLTVSPTKIAMAKNLTIPVKGFGGTPPYTYSVQSGGGSIDVNGIYTSPNAFGHAVVRVTDSVPNFVDIPVMIGNYEQLFCDIIQKELGLANGRVYLWDQKINQPIDAGLYIAVEVLSTKPFANINKVEDDGLGGFQQVQSVNMQATLCVDVISRGLEARDRKEEVIMALKSIYAEQQQELNSFNIALLSSGFVNLSNVDGAAIPYRFNITVNIQYEVSKITAIDYYDTFPAPTLTTDPYP